MKLKEKCDKINNIKGRKISRGVNQMAKQKRCAAKTKSGKKCKNKAAGRSKFCAVHKK
ncbi:MAG: hypothetical protein K9L87_01835 [Candidatus Omnitrophica bacterium]|nr:hypothetical protein [Candidatus Omnitrophota bacterium]MCF7909258.1 hypothetical protein [Candidatus Omnitrophota bacterium]